MHPRPGGNITWARAACRTLRGHVETAWRIDDGAFHLDVAVPPSTTATVHIPATTADVITEGGAPLRDAAGIIAVHDDSPHGMTLVDVGAGRYSFRAPRG